MGEGRSTCEVQPMTRREWLAAMPGLAVPAWVKPPPGATDLFAPKNLVAWCIVPFDRKKRSPAERVEMLSRLGFTRFAYDWRSQHLPSFDEEVQLLKRRRIELTAVWFPANLGPDARSLLGVIEKHDLKTQLWVTMGEPAGRDAVEKLTTATQAIRPLAEAADKLGCKIALYNHGGWFGEPENQVAIIERLDRKNVGIVYNQHHGHDHIDRFPHLLKLMLPHLRCLNLNGMVKGGDKIGKKIVPLAQGELDIELLTAIRESGYLGPIGILGHTDDDAEERLADNLDGLNWLRVKLTGKDPGPKPTCRTWKA